MTSCSSRPNPLSGEICPGLNSSTEFTKTAKIRNYCNFHKIPGLFYPLPSQQHVGRTGIFMLYLPNEIC